MNQFLIYLFMPSGVLGWQMTGMQAEPAKASLLKASGVSQPICGMDRTAAGYQTGISDYAYHNSKHLLDITRFCFSVLTSFSKLILILRSISALDLQVYIQFYLGQLPLPCPLSLSLKKQILSKD